MDRNQRQGAVAELRVALALVESGCAVNSMTQMDFGMDLNVQIPLEMPTPDTESWEMSQTTANLQIKSSRSDVEAATIPQTVAAAWSDAAPHTSPTYVILSIGDDYYAFGTARIRDLALRSRDRRRRKLYNDLGWSDNLGEPPGLDGGVVTLSSKNGLPVTASDLPELVFYWTRNAGILDALARCGIDASAGLRILSEDAVLGLAGMLVAAYAATFYDFDEYKHFSGGGSEETVGLALDLVRTLLGDRVLNAHAAAMSVASSIPVTTSGWGVTHPLHLFTSANSPESARTALIEASARLAVR